MRSRAPQLLAFTAAILIFQATGAAQIMVRPTPDPIVTAESETWYLNGNPITFAGNIYYPTGPDIYFKPYEMVRSGDYNGVPLYSRTTIEPWSIVYVPLPGRVMKPYERRRTGELVGTVGSSLPSFPVVHSLTESEYALPQAPTSPMLGATVYERSQLPVVVVEVQAPAPVPTATAGSAPEAPPGPLVSAKLPEGLDGIFIEYRDRRWFASGHAQELDTSQFVMVGDYRGFAVYRKGDDERTIYVAVAKSARELVAPYSAR
jgi:hypothetical protein